MLKRITAIAVALAFLPSVSFAQSPKRSIRTAASEAVARMADAQRPAAQGRNPYATTALVLMAGGGTLMVLGFLSTTGVECSTNNSGTSVSCGTSSNKGLIFAGLGAAVAGGLLYRAGEQRRRAPMIAPIPGGFFVTGSYRF